MGMGDPAGWNWRAGQRREQLERLFERARNTPADAILRRDPPRPWCRACGQDWIDNEPCCDVRRELLRLAAENKRLRDK